MNTVNMAKLRVTIDVDGIPRTLFSAKERRNGELTVKVKHGEGARSLGTLGAVAEPHPETERIRVVRYSVHMSENSTTGANQIKQTKEFVQGPNETIYHITEAIKRNTGYAPVLVRKCPALILGRYNASQKTEVQRSLGSYSPQQCTLLFAVAFASPNYASNCGNLGEIQFEEFSFSRVKIAVLWWFMRLPSNHTGFSRRSLTLDPSSLGTREAQGMRKIMSGFTIDEFVEYFCATSEEIYSEHIHVLRLDPTMPNELLTTLDHIPSYARFSRKGIQ